MKAFLAAGMSPGDMREPVFNIKRKDIWDLGRSYSIVSNAHFLFVTVQQLLHSIGGFGGLLKGQLAQALLEKYNSRLKSVAFLAYDNKFPSLDSFQ